MLTPVAPHGTGSASDASPPIGLATTADPAHDSSATAAAAAAHAARPTGLDPGPQAEADLPLSGHAAIDSGAGRIYATAIDTAGRLVTAVFESEDSRLVDTFDTSGALAIDSGGGLLFVERTPGGAVGHYGSPGNPRPILEPGDRELVTLDARDGSVIRTVPLPPAASPTLLVATTLAPLFDSGTGAVIVFREHQVLRIDPETGDVLAHFDTGVTYSDDDARAGQGPVPVHRAFIDPPSRIMYLAFVTLDASPWSGHTIVSHHLDSFAIRGRGDYPTSTYSTAAGGRLFGQMWNRSGFTSAWQWRDGAPFSTRMGPPDPPIGTAVDLETDRLFAANTTHLRVLDSDTMLPQRMLPHGLQDASEVSLIGFDSASGHLVFVADGALRLLRWPE